VEWFFIDSGVLQVDTAGWMQRSKLKEGPAALSAMNARRNVQRAHVVALVLDAQEVSYINHFHHSWRLQKLSLV
jgi:predicted GTPase